MDTGLMFSSDGDFWRTPRELFAWHRLADLGFTLDAAANDGAVCPHFINAQQDALSTPWDGRVWCNPPYSIADKFIATAVHQARYNQNCEGVCLLVPARTDTAWWQDSWPDWDLVLFLRGRLKFWMTPDELAVVNEARAAKVPPKPPLGAENSAPFPSAVLINGFGLRRSLGTPAVECVDWKAELKRQRAAA